ncbi:hypothetical protein IP81_02970 [Novosphingobium sp. AAP83]|nr:hypothetical protein IP81_02970 [Novosphingobium sp. AAP83]
MSAPAFAQGVVTSVAPDNVSVSVYRAPNRGSDTAMNLSWLEGYALITEKRTVDIPAGKATIRFEGVAAGLFPESAIVTGLPSGVREKNLDADLLSPRSLYARMFGRPVTLRRTLPGSGGVREERAVIRSGVDGAAIVQTAAGFEVATCGGLQDELIYPEAPKDLSARPTLSIETEAAQAHKATVSLSYLAWGFDWQTNYVVTMNPDGRTASLSAWVTLASSDSTSFANAEAAVIAGKVNRTDKGRGTAPSGGALVLKCSLSSPLATRASPASLPEKTDAQLVFELTGDDSLMNELSPAPQVRAFGLVRARVEVKQEALGDLKLYRVPVPVTVAANSQKQVALALKKAVKMEALYRAEVWEDSADGVRQMLRTRNRKEEGLGLPLPGGPVTVFEPQGDAVLLSGEGGLADRAVGEDVEIMLANATQVTLEAQTISDTERAKTVRLTARNARGVPVQFEARIASGAGEQIVGLKTAPAGGKVTRKDGRTIWAVTIPANGSVSWNYTLVQSQ